MTIERLIPLLPLVISCIAMVGTVAALLVSMPKVKADTIHVETQALAQLVAGFGLLSSAQQKRIEELIALLQNAEQKANLAGQYARRCEQLEAELKANKQARYADD